jgi:ABC-type thiamine transport system ATPase subunit
VVNDVPPKERDIAMVFQNYALYPHMTVADNMAFSLKLRKAPRPRSTSGRRAADILGLTSCSTVIRASLSGGQRQRVAMGRAIVRDPQVFLFDEPLSNLDAKLRVQMRTEIKELHQRLKTTTVYVTHDQIEAMTMADKIVVMHDGIVEQMGAPLDLYDRPEQLCSLRLHRLASMNLPDRKPPKGMNRKRETFRTCKTPRRSIHDHQQTTSSRRFSRTRGCSRTEPVRPYTCLRPGCPIDLQARRRRKAAAAALGSVRTGGRSTNGLPTPRRFSDATGVEVRIDKESWEDVRPKAAVAANVGSGPDLMVMSWFDDPQQYPDKLLDVTELGTYLGGAHGGWYEGPRRLCQARRQVHRLPLCAIGNAIVYRDSHMKEAGFQEFPKDTAGFLELCKALQAKGIRLAFRTARLSATATTTRTGCCGAMAARWSTRAER